MKKRLFALLSLLPLALSAQQIDLSGHWDFAVDSTDVGIAQKWYKKTFAEQVKLPGSMTTNGKGNDITVDTKWTSWVADSSWYRKPLYEKWRQPDNVKVIFWLQPEKEYVGPAWYKRTFTVSKDMEGQELVLNMERVHWESTVWLDGKMLGMQNSLSTAHRYDLGNLRAGTHTICVRIDNRIKDINVGINAHSLADHTQTNWNGIAGGLYIEARPQVNISNISVYPDNDRGEARVTATLRNTTGRTITGKLSFAAESRFTPALQRLASLDKEVSVAPGEQCIEVTYPMGKDFYTWDEHRPYLYEMAASFDGEGIADRQVTTFGMRKLSTHGRQFAINDRTIFLRGTLDCATFPRTGYPPTDIAEWRRIFTICKNHGLNHVRFHSWCPPKAAFDAADQIGIYLQVEGASWTSIVGDGTPFDKWIYEESERIMKEYGNHPSFILYTYGNEPGGANMNTFLGNLITHLKKIDPRHKYTSAAGWPAIPENDYNNDMYPRINVWYAGLNSHINANRPSTDYNWFEIIDKYDHPYVAHESGNWCVYPNFKEIDKYDGCVVRAKNFEVFQEMLADNGLSDLAETYLKASGHLQALCWKAEFEAALRTPDFAGLQILSLSDFPGQGTALVGVLDAFWEEKGYIAPEEFKRFAGETVPLALMEKLVWNNNETFKASVEAAHFGAEPLTGVVPSWTLSYPDGEVIAFGNLPRQDVAIGNCLKLGNIEYDLNEFTRPEQLKLTVDLAGHRNDWDIWVYPAGGYVLPDGVRISDKLDTQTAAFLEAGGNVLFTPRKGDIRPEAGGEVTLGMSTIFWNTGWTVHQQPPYAFGVLVDPGHPAMQQFPTDFHSNFQWWDAMMNGNAVKLDLLDKKLTPIVRIIDDWFQNWSLGLIFEARVGKGRILVCGVDLLTDTEKRPEAIQLIRSLTSYMASDKFTPNVELSVDKLRSIVK